MSNEIDRDALPENLKGTYDDLNGFIETYIRHVDCVDHHFEEMERLQEEITPRIQLIVDHLKEHGNLRVFDEFMNTLVESKPDDEGFEIPWAN